MSRKHEEVARAPIGPIPNNVRHEIRWLVDTLYEMQKMATRNTNRGSALARGVDTSSTKLTKNIETFGGSLALMEAALLKQLKPLIEAHPLGSRWSGVKGVGPSLGAKLIGLIDKVQLYPPCLKHERGRDRSCEDCHRPTGKRGAECFETPSKLGAFAGLTVVDGRCQVAREGELRSFNSRLKSLLLGPLAEQFIRQGNAYSDLIYRPSKVMYGNRPPICTACLIEGKKKPSYSRGRCDCWPPMRVERAARRRMMKIFLQHVWEVWRLAEGLPIRLPYVIEHLGHETLYRPEYFGWDVSGL